MDDYGLITIDNRNLLDDLLGLSEQDENPSQLNKQRFDYASLNKIPQNQVQDERKVFLESPTFTRREDDIYRYVHSRLSSVDPVTINNRNIPKNDQVNDENQNFSFNNEKIASNKFKIKNSQLLPQPLNRNINTNNNNNTNRLLSDIAVASLPRNNNPQKNSKVSLDDQLYDNDLLDSLDTTNNNNFYANTYTNQNVNPYNSIQNFQEPNQQFSQQAFVLNNQSQHFYQQQQLQQQQLQQQQLQQQILQQQQQLQLYQNQQKPGSVFTILPSPTTNNNSIPIVQSSLQFQPTPPAPQFFPIPLQTTPYLQSQQGQNMFVQEPLQPMFYNPAYPMNIGGQIQNANNFYNQQNEFDNYQYHADYYNNQFMNPQPQSYQQQNGGGNKYDAQPLQPPPQMATPRTNHTNNSNNNKRVNQVEFKQNNIEYDSPDSDDNTDLNNEFNSMKVDKAPQNNNNNNNNSNNNNNMSDDDARRQEEVWKKLQTANRKETKGSGQSKSSGLPPVGNKSVVKTKPPPFERKPESNFLEKNVDAIRNKENLTHRYPEKKYEAFYGKNIGTRVKYFQGADKVKPPHQLQPIDNYNDDFQTVSVDINNQEDLYSNKRISIPIKPNTFKDKDHINLDINLRLVDFLPNQNSNRNRSFDDFEVNNEPLSQHIKRFESLSRSLPGSSGSLNKLKPLPPVNRRTGNSTLPPENTRLQHEHDHEMRYEDGYLAQLQKAQNRPVIKTYTLKDYRNFKKDAIPNSSTNTGKLGPDFESDIYKQKVEVSQKKVDYAERVKARNKILLAEKVKNDEDDSLKSMSQQSKTQRAKDYVRNNVIRPRSGSRPISNELDNEETFKNSPVKFLSSDRSYRGESIQNFKQNNKSQVKLDLNNKQRSIDRAIVRIRDPVTSKIRTLYLSDNQLDELSQRHEQDKNKVNSILNNNSNNNGVTNRSNSNNSNKGDINNLNNITNNNNQSQSSNNLSNTLNNSNTIGQNHHNSNHGIIIKNHKTPVDLGRSKIMEEYDRQKAEDEEFQKMMERHNAEKNKVNEFDASPYLQENIVNIENEIKVE